MKNLISLILLGFMMWLPAVAENVQVSSPDGKLQVEVQNPRNGRVYYTVTYNGKKMLESSPLGMDVNYGDFTRDLKLTGHQINSIDKTYQQDRIKVSSIRYQAKELVCSFENLRKQKMDITFRVSNNDVAFRYTLYKSGETGSVVVNDEATGFRFPMQTTTFLTPQSDAMIGWKRTKPSYEEDYVSDAPMHRISQYGHGFTFPCLFKVGENGWVLVSETDVDSRYCGSRLSDVKEGNLYKLEFPMPEENNGNGTVAPAFALPGSTPWRTITVGETLKPIVETTIPWDVVEPRYEASCDYKMGRGTWSWILWQDGSINYEDQVKYKNAVRTSLRNTYSVLFYSNIALSACSKVLTFIICTLPSNFIGTLLSGTINLVNPRLIPSIMRRSGALTRRTSPVNPTSPKASTPLGTGLLR